MGDAPNNSEHLTDQQERFCQEYLKDLNAKQSTIRAGYSDNPESAEVQGSRLLGNAKVKARIQQLMDQRSLRTQLTADKILMDIEDVRIRCMQGEPVLDREGNETGEWKFEAHAALKASELQGKHLKMFTDKVEHSGHLAHKFETLSDVELDQRINERLEAAQKK